MSGTKHDGGKPRMDLLSSAWLLGVGDVLTYGAKKYSRYAACDCAKNASGSIGREDFVKIITTSISKGKIQSIELDKTSMPKSGLERIADDWLNTIVDEVATKLQNATGLPDLKSTPFLQEVVIFALEKLRFVSITATEQEKFEALYASPAMWELVGSREWIGSKKHRPTCASLKLIETGAHNWRKGIQTSRLMAAAQRHLLAYNEGEDLDPETSLSHLLHASCCLMFAYELSLDKPELDDRYKRKGTSKNENKETNKNEDARQ
jgi:hypothetical protein